MHSEPPPKGTDAKSIENCAMCPVHRRAVRYEYKAVSMDKMNLTQIDRGWMGLEEHLITTEAVIRGFDPSSINIKGVHSVPNLHMVSRNSVNSYKRLKKGSNFWGGAHRHGAGVDLCSSKNKSPSSYIHQVSQPKFTRETIHALSKSKWGQVIGDAYLHGLGLMGSIIPWQIQSWVEEQQGWQEDKTACTVK